MSVSAFLARHLADGAILVILTHAAGSTPRETGATMVASETGAAGTIGGGQLEFHCLDIARAMLEAGETERALDIPLGPQMGQCCGGRVQVSLRRATSADLAMQVARERAEAGRRPSVLVFGAGHTGRALVEALAPLPLRVTLIDDRDGVMDGLPAAVTCIRMADPVAAVATAPPGAAPCRAHPQPRARLPADGSRAAAGRCGLCRHDRLGDQAGAVRGRLPARRWASRGAVPPHLPDRRQRCGRQAAAGHRGLDGRRAGAEFASETRGFPRSRSGGTSRP